MGGLWSRTPIKNLSSHQKKIFSDLVKFHYGLSSEAIARKKSILALSFEIFALSQSRYGLCSEAIANKKSILALSFEIFAPKKFFYGHSQISLWAVYGVEDQ